jgi:hypothetical protein
MALRMMRLAAGGALATREANRMVVEKAAAIAEAQCAAAAALAGARGPSIAAKRALDCLDDAESGSFRCRLATALFSFRGLCPVCHVTFSVTGGMTDLR